MRKPLPAVLEVVGCIAVVVGLSMVYLPAGIIAGGAVLILVGYGLVPE